jgi:hypothetical protein
MGSFNVACRFTGSISPGEQATLVLLLPTHLKYKIREYHNDEDEAIEFVKIEPTTNIVTNDGAESLYTVIGVVHGTYADYGDIRDIENTGTSEALASWFGISVNQFIDLVCNRYRPEHGGMVWKDFMEPHIYDFMNDSVPFSEDYLKVLGFRETDSHYGKTYIHPLNSKFQVYIIYNSKNGDIQQNPVIPGVDIDKEWFYYDNGFVVVNNHGDVIHICQHNYDKKQRLLGLFSEFTNGYFLGYPESMQIKLRVLSNISGMWMRREVWNAYSEGIFPSNELKSTCAGDDHWIGAGDDALIEAGLIEVEIDSSESYSDHIFVCPGETLETSEFIIKTNYHTAFICRRSGHEFIKTDKYGFHRMHELASEYEKISGKKLPLVGTNDPSYIFSMRMAINQTETAIRLYRRMYKDTNFEYRSYLYDVFSSSAMRTFCDSQGWNVVKYIYIGKDGLLDDNYVPPIIADKRIQHELIAIRYLRTNMFMTSQLIMPTYNGPQCGDNIAERHAAEIHLKILNSRMKHYCEERILNLNDETVITEISDTDEILIEGKVPGGILVQLDWEHLFIPNKYLTELPRRPKVGDILLFKDNKLVFLEK